MELPDRWWTDMTRRVFLRRAIIAATASVGGGMLYPFLEAKWLRVSRRAIELPSFPDAFDGFKVALLTDIHHGPFVPLIYVQHAVAVTNRLKPDLICLVGDYVHRSGKYIGPSIDALGALRASSGVYAVLGNHDHWEGAEETRAALKANGVPDLTNRGIWIERGPDRVRLGGVGDLWEDVQELDGTLEGVQDCDTTLLLSHNPDYVEKIRDRRISLVLSGHTHGGQVVIPFIGPPLVPSSYGKKYASGLVRTEHTQVFVSRGVGTITPPVRFLCRPDVVIITLSRSDSKAQANVSRS